MKVTIHGSEELAKFVAQLIKEGVSFDAKPLLNGVNIVSYLVEFNGGY